MPSVILVAFVNSVKYLFLSLFGSICRLWYLYSKYFDIYVRLLGLDLIRRVFGKKAR